MPKLVWLHRFNKNELGLGGKRGSFCLVPVEARAIFFPKIDFNEIPKINETVTVFFQDQNVSYNVTYSKPPSKSEHRLSLSGFGEYIGDVTSGKMITPDKIGCFYRKEDILCFSIANAGSVYDQLLKDFPSRGLNNNLVTNTIFVNSKSKTSTLDHTNTLNNVIELPKPFLLLAGISGTGKTRFVRQQAEAHGVSRENFCVVPVRPDWHEPSDLLGYISRIGERPKYVTTKVIQFIIAAWRAIAPNANADGMGDLNTSSPPYWLCLDEMNLAPVEQYFADYLSALESRKFSDGEYTCEPLLDKSILNTKGVDMWSDLGLTKDQGLWDFFLKNGITIPPNLIVAGTVNMDETTHGFSRKVIDRALTIDFGEFFPNDFDKIYGGQDVPKIFTYGMISQTTSKEINSKADPDGLKTINFLKEVNVVLKNTPFELAYRALNELLLCVHSFAPNDSSSLQAVWDDFLMTKVLPRIDGDDDKLRITVGESHENLLDKLEEVASEQLSEIWEDNKRIDLFRERIDGSAIDDIACRSKKKIQWMKERLDRNTFTSYWP